MKSFKDYLEEARIVQVNPRRTQSRSDETRSASVRSINPYKYADPRTRIKPENFGRVTRTVHNALDHLRLQSDELFIQPITGGVVVYIKNTVDENKVRRALENENSWKVQDFDGEYDNSDLWAAAFVLKTV